MAWPTLQEYNEAIQNPQTAFDDLELKAGKPELDKLGLPRPRTGQFASVYRMKCAQRDWAVRCFSQEVKDQQERYRAIDEYISPPLNIPYIVEFNYITKGILVKGKWYPILRMEWIKGEEIGKYIERNLNNASALRQLAVKWVEMLKGLQANSIAHGDLQHGNVLVVGDTLKLVDYDGMFVPALQGKLSHELGQPNYQHPNRMETDFGLYLDNFSAWVIYASLVALSIDPSLWERTKAGDDCLLFRKADFEEPLLSQTFGLLIGHRDLNIRTLARVFRSTLFFPPQQVPSLNGQIPLATQTDTLSLSNQRGWWSDHGNSNTKSQVGAEILPTKQASSLAASWILDFVSPSENTRERFFRNSFAFPRLFAVLSVLIFLIFLKVAVPFIGSLYLTGDPLYSDILILFGSVFTFVLVGYLNIMTSVWRYQKEPPVIEKRNLLAREKKTREPLAGFEKLLAGFEKTKNTLKNEENRQRKELDTVLKRLQEQERLELDNAQTAYKKIIASIESRQRTVDQEEKEKLAKLNETIGVRVNSLKQQIASVTTSEVNEITRELAAIQNQYKDDYLRRNSINKAPLRGLQYASRSTLESALLASGIRTAYDISYARVDAVPQFGPKRTETLVHWRSELLQEATKLMPYDLAPNVKNAIRAKYGSQKKSLDDQRDVEQEKFSMEDRVIRDRSRIAKQSLELEQSTAREQSNQKVQEISKRLAQEYIKPTGALNQLAAEFSSKLREVDEQSKKVRQQMFAVSWQNAKIRHDYLAYRNISFFNYLKVVYFGYHAK